MRRRRDIWRDVEWCRAFLPYGVRTDRRTWRTIIFNRNYVELWSSPASGGIVAGDGTTLVACADHYFWADSNPPWECERTRARCHDILDTWGVPIVDPLGSAIAPVPTRAAARAFQRWGRGMGGAPPASCWL